MSRTLTRGMIRAVVAVAPTLEEVLAFCAEDPVERVFLEDIARRGLGRFTALAENGRVEALCHSGANLVPSGRGCGAFAQVVARSRPRMVMVERNRAPKLWSAASRSLQ